MLGVQRRLIEKRNQEKVYQSYDRKPLYDDDESTDESRVLPPKRVLNAKHAGSQLDHRASLEAEYAKRYNAENLRQAADIYGSGKIHESYL